MGTDSTKGGLKKLFVSVKTWKGACRITRVGRHISGINVGMRWKIVVECWIISML